MNFHLLVHSLDGHNVQGWARQRGQEPLEPKVGLPWGHGSSGTWALFCCLPRCTILMGSGAAVTGTGALWNASITGSSLAHCAAVGSQY